MADKRVGAALSEAIGAALPEKSALARTPSGTLALLSSAEEAPEEDGPDWYSDSALEPEPEPEPEPELLTEPEQEPELVPTGGGPEPDSAGAVSKVCEVTGVSESDAAAALAACGGDVRQAVERLLELTPRPTAAAPTRSEPPPL